MSETQKITALFFLLPSEFNDAKSYEILLICQTKCVNLQALKYFAMEKEEKYKLLKQQIEALVAGGVCGTAWQRAETIVVPDVEQFPGHIACSSLSRSEIVVPLFNTSREVVAVLDIDSRELNTFDDIDRYWLELIVRVVMV